MIKTRRHFNHKAEYLFYLQNDLGFNNLEICVSGVKKDGTLWFSKWLKFFDLLHTHPKEKVWKTLTRDEFIMKASHRTVLDIELVFDIDSESPVITTKRTEEILNYIHNGKKAFEISNYYVYFTGSKSIHIHCFIPKIRRLGTNGIYTLKKQILQQLGADVQKAAQRNMIAIEGEPHYKTGKPKQEVTDIWK